MTSPTAITLHRFRDDEWTVYRDIRLRALRSDPGVFGSNHAKESAYADHEWQTRLADPDNAVFGVFDGPDCAGMIGIAVRAKDETRQSAIIWGVWLAPELRGRGLSDPMYRACIDWAKSRPDILRVVISHRKSNVASMHASLRQGFVFTHAEPHDWPDGVHEDEMCYKLDLLPKDAANLSA